MDTKYLFARLSKFYEFLIASLLWTGCPCSFMIQIEVNFFKFKFKILQISLLQPLPDILEIQVDLKKGGSSGGASDALLKETVSYFFHLTLKGCHFLVVYFEWGCG